MRLSDAWREPAFQSSPVQWLLPSITLLIILASGPLQAITAPEIRYAHVSSLTGAELAKICAQDDAETPAGGGVSLSACNAYILGAADQLSINKGFCLVSASYAARVLATVKRYLRTNTDKGNQPPVTLIRDALTTAFPCKSG